MGYIRKATDRGYLEHPRFACRTDDMLEIFVHFGRCLCCFVPLFVNRQVRCPHTNSRSVLLLRKRARSGGAEWVCVTRRPAKQAKKPRVQ